MPLDASLALLALAPAAYFSTLPGIAPHRSQLLATAGVAAAGFFLTTALVPIVAKLTHRRGAACDISAGDPGPPEVSSTFLFS